MYRALASRRGAPEHGQERESLLALARAEERHAQHWAELLGQAAEGAPPSRGLRERLLSWLARRVSALLVLAVVQRAEQDGSYEADLEATAEMAADERIHARIVAGLARRRRVRAAGLLRASVFGINDGLVSNVSLVLGMAGARAQPEVVLLTGIAGLLAGALSMAAGEYVSVRSQRELLTGSSSDVDPAVLAALTNGDLDQLTDLLQASGMPAEEAKPFAATLVRHHAEQTPDSAEVVGAAWGAALSSFGAFAAGAFVPVAPYLGDARHALAGAVGLTAAALFTAGAAVGILTGGRLVSGGLRQLALGAAAAATTYGLGSVLGVAIG